MEDGGGGNNMEFSNRMFLQDENGEDARMMEPSRNFVNPVYETMFQECQAPIIKPGADLSSLPSSGEQATLLCQDQSIVGEESGLLRDQETPPPGRAVIHTDSD